MNKDTIDVSIIPLPFRLIVAISFYLSVFTSTFFVVHLLTH